MTLSGSRATGMNAAIVSSGQPEPFTVVVGSPSHHPRSLRRRRCGGVKWVVGPCCASLCRSDFGGRPTRELLGEGRSR